MTSSWWLLEIAFPSELEDSLFWKLDDLGINRFASEYSPDNPFELNLFVWLPAGEWRDASSREELLKSLRALSEPFGLSFGRPIWEVIVDEDWSCSWKQHWMPDPVGNHFLILPAWLDLPKEYSDRVVIHIDPGSAFGTGSHPTTRLCLEALEKTSISSKIVADLGCGSGILGIAAMAIGAKQVFAVDNDPLAVCSTHHNSKLNQLDVSRLRVLQGSVEVLASELNKEKVDLLLCNILAPVIEALAPRFGEVLSDRGQAFLSGLLVSQIPRVKRVLEESGWHVWASFQKDGWALLEVRKPLKDGV